MVFQALNRGTRVGKLHSHRRKLGPELAISHLGPQELRMQASGVTIQYRVAAGMLLQPLPRGRQKSPYRFSKLLHGISINAAITG